MLKELKFFSCTTPNLLLIGRPLLLIYIKTLEDLLPQKGTFYFEAVFLIFKREAGLAVFLKDLVRPL